MATRTLRRDSDSASLWLIRTRGSFAILSAEGDVDLTPRGRKARAILAYLSSNIDIPVPRERIMELLWGSRGEAQARASLRQALLEIRHSAGAVIQTDRDHLILAGSLVKMPEPVSAAPVAAFEDLGHITPEFDEWLLGERERRARERWSKLRSDAERLLERGEGAAALPLLDEMAQIDPYDEDGLRLALQAEAQAGHSAGLERRYHELAERLQRDLSIAPALETRELRARLLKELAAQPEQQAPVSAPPAAAAATSSSTAVLDRPWLGLVGGAALLATIGLTQSANTMAAVQPRLAILPFAAAAGADPALAEGLSDELLSQLARNPGLRVIGRTSSEQFKGKPADLRTVGRRLGAQYVVEGRVAPAGDGVRVMVSLIRAKDGSAIFAKNFRGRRNELQSVNAAIGSTIAQSLGSAAPTVRNRPANGEAYALYLQAKGLIRERTTPGLATAMELLSTAVRLDPTFAPAWAQLSAIPKLKDDITAIPHPLEPGQVMTPLDSAKRAVALDPNLAEAHAMMAFAHGFDTSAGQKHLRRALALDPNDPQTVYWWALASDMRGNFREGAKAVRRSADLDPLWKRPVQLAAVHEHRYGDPALAEQYIRRINAGNPDGAVEAEIGYANAIGDFSRAIGVAFTNPRLPRGAGKGTVARILASLGFSREAILYHQVGPFGRTIISGRLPPVDVLLREARIWTAQGADEPFYLAILWGLARQNRWSDIAALHEAGHGLIADLGNTDPNGRGDRIVYGAITALALYKAGRREEAVRVALAADEAVRFAAARGPAAAEMLAAMAATDAVLGRPETALSRLELAFAKGWRMNEYAFRPMSIAEDPTFATLRGRPRFEQLLRRIEAEKDRERREIAALGVL